MKLAMKVSIQQALAVQGGRPDHADAGNAEAGTTAILDGTVVEVAGWVRSRRSSKGGF